MNTPSFDDFARILATDTAMPAATTREWLTKVQNSNRYDLGQLLHDPEIFPYLMDLKRENSDANGDAVIRFGASDPDMLMRWQRGDLYVFAHWAVADAQLFFWLWQDGVWVPSPTQPLDTFHKIMVSTEYALLLIQEAELNNAENVEFVDREAMSPHGTPARQRFATKRIRTISLTQTRKQYLGFGKSHQGGTHARPCEHVRVLTEKVITPKNRKPYIRKAKVITVNAGVRRETRVTL